ncbi:hypothetical protein JCM8097_000396 [Rhodosporidiobolus ruineniae]
MKLTINSYHAVATWRWNLKLHSASSSDEPTVAGEERPADEEEEDDDEDDVCGICRAAFDGCCPDCKVPGDGCPPIWGECTHVFHMHCLLKWLATESSKQQCPMDRRAWVTAGTPTAPAAPDRLAAPPIPSTPAGEGEGAPAEVIMA